MSNQPADGTPGITSGRSMENTCHVLSRMRVYWFANRHGADRMENTSYFCHARLSGQVFTACCIATSTVRTHSEHCFYCCVFVGTCLLSRCLTNGSIRQNRNAFSPSVSAVGPSLINLYTSFQSYSEHLCCVRIQTLMAVQC
jgi:hypothetical protein